MIQARATEAPLLFFDLGTTGLSGGAGTVAFLVGCGYCEGETFHTKQFCVTAPAHPAAADGTSRIPRSEKGHYVASSRDLGDSPGALISPIVVEAEAFVRTMQRIWEGAGKAVMQNRRARIVDRAEVKELYEAAEAQTRV